MEFEWGWRVVAHTLSVPVTGTLAVVAWRNRRTRGSRELATLLGSLVVWNGLAPITVGAESTTWTAFFGGLMLAMLALTVYALLEFTLVYTGRDDWLTPRKRALLLLHPAAMLVLTLTDATVGIAPGALQQSLVFESVELAPQEFYGTDSEWGPAFYVHTLYSYVLVAASTYLIVDLVNRSNDAYGGQAVLLVGAIAVPWVINVLDLFTPLLSDTLGLGFFLTGVLLFVGVRRHELGDVAPVARDEVLDSLDGAVVVLDRDDRLADYNPAAGELLGIDESDVGRPADEALSHLDDVWERYADVDDVQDELAYDTGDGWRHFSLQVSPLDGAEGARSFLIHDVTDRVRREQELESQKERLDQFASIVSHDLRNPLNVAQGRLEMVEADSENVAAIERSHDRMASLIDEVLTLARSGQAVSETAPVDVGGVAGEAWATVDTGAVELTVETDRAVDADRERLRTALENCFRNAIEHGGPDLTTVRVGTVAEDAVFSPGDRGLYVADDGAGFDGDPERALEPGHTTAREGTGLGLSIVESVVDGHGWSLSAGESQSGGARVEFRGVALGGDESSAEDDRAETVDAVSDD
jgi:signal transduction histidine kinase